MGSFHLTRTYICGSPLLKFMSLFTYPGLSNMENLTTGIMAIRTAEFTNQRRRQKLKHKEFTQCTRQQVCFLLSKHGVVIWRG